VVSGVDVVTEIDASDVVPPTPNRGFRLPWKAIIGLAGLAGLLIAAITTVDDARQQGLPGAWALVGALALHTVALIFQARGWVALFPRGVNRLDLSMALFTSQLTKYLPAGGLVQVASQVALSSEKGTVGRAALRMPVFVVCGLVAAVTLGSAVAVNSDLPAWSRWLAVAALALLAALDRRVLAAILRAVRRVISRVPEPEELPEQQAILVCFGWMLLNVAAFSVAFVILLGDLTDIDPLTAGAAIAASWAVGYAVVVVPSGMVVREAALLAALPALGAAPLLAASVAHRLVGFVAEASLSGVASIRARRARRRSAP
jgi:uncharacterized membrane protein YbhN (UPF0104 family)